MLRNLIVFGLRSVSRRSLKQIPKKSLPRINFHQLYCSNAVPTAAESEAEIEKRKKIILLEMEVCRQEGLRVPDRTELKQKEWDELLWLPSRSARCKFYSFLWKNEKITESKVERKERHTIEVAKRRAAEKEAAAKDNHLVYGLHHNTMFLRIYDTAIDRFHNARLLNALQFGEKLVFDCSYDDQMEPVEARNTAKQISMCFAYNRTAPDPFDIHFCNVNYDKTTMQSVEIRHPTLRNPEYPMNLHEESYLELFPRKNLVYLTPHCREELLEYNPNDIYIIGAIVDKKNTEPISLAKAKSQGIRMARLPLDRYLRWGGGSGKSLTLDQMVKIMLEIKQSGDWNKALEHVPKRKLFEYRQQILQKETQKVQLGKFQDYKFDVETWGGKQFTKHSEKKVAKRTESNKRSPRIVLESILGEDK